MRKRIGDHGQMKSLILSLRSFTASLIHTVGNINFMDFRDKKQYHDHYELISEHIDKYFGDVKINVFHEIPTLDIHLDVYHISPADANYDVLLTSGMSSIAMNVTEIPEHSESYKFAELMTMIPKGTAFGKIYPSNIKSDWILSMLKQTAKFPHFYDTWIGVGHTIQAEAELKPYSDQTKYCGCIVLPTMSFPEEFQTVKSKEGEINIYGLFPLYKEEIQFKIEHGYNEFVEFLIKNNTPEIIDFDRVNFCPGV